MKDINMTLDEIQNAIHLQLFSGYANNSKLHLDYVTDEDYTRLCELRDRIDHLTDLDEKFKYQFCSDLDTTVLTACGNAYDIGFRIGVSILKCLLNAEIPVLQITHRPAERLEREKPVYECSSFDNKLLTYLKNAMPHLTDVQKARLQERTTYFVEENTTERDGLF